jgi:hypothetical protein
MARATKAEIAGRIEEIVPLLLDGLRVREIRAVVARKTSWGAAISEAQLKRYVAAAHREITGSPCLDRSAEVAKARLRYERTLARSAAAGDSRTYLAAVRGLCALFGLNAPSAPGTAATVTHIERLRAALEEQIAQAIAAGGADAAD